MIIRTSSVDGMERRRLAGTLATLATVGALALTGCAATGAAPGAAADDGSIQVVASTSVYGDIAATIGGDRIAVTSIIDSIAQDPHSYEASARDQLTVSRADLIIANGGGYDAFLDGLVEASGTTAPVISAVEFSHDFPGNAGHDETDAGGHDHSDHDHADAADGDPADAADSDPADAADDHDHADHDHDDADHDDAADAAHDHDGHTHIEGFNEHVWYDPHTMEHVVEDIAHELGGLDAAKADTFEANAKKLIDGIAGLETSLEKIKADHAGEKIFVTEPVPLYLTAAAGLENATPEAFSEAVEEGQDVPPATMLEATKILGSGEVRTALITWSNWSLPSLWRNANCARSRRVNVAWLRVIASSAICGLAMIFSPFSRAIRA